MKIDSHQHFWKYSPEDLPWIGEELSVLKNDFLPSDLEPILQENGIDGCVAVQASQTEMETSFLLTLAHDNSFIKGVVGWVDLCASNVEEKLENVSQIKQLKGIRHIVQDEPDDQFLLLPGFQRGVSLLHKYGLTYDILIFPRHLEIAEQFVRSFPDQPFVLDHMAKPSIKKGEILDWKTKIEKLAQSENVSCKMSGMVTEADWDNWKLVQLTPYLDVILEAFGAKRLMFGSDWPVCLLAGQYNQVHNIVKEYIVKLSDDEQEDIMGRNASRFYNLVH